MSDNDKFIRLLYRRCLVSSMLAILGSVLGLVVGAMLVGRALGPEELTVIGVTLPVYYVYATAGALLGVGGTTVCARLIGKGRIEESRLAFTLVYALTLIIAAALTAVLLIFSGPITALLGVPASDDIFDKVRRYTQIISIGGVLIMSIYPAFNFLRLDGRNTAAAAIFFVMAAVSILINSILLLAMGWDVTGAAIATVCGAGAAGILGAALLFTRSDNFRLSMRGFGKQRDDGKKTVGWRLVADIFRHGSPSALENLCVVLRTVTINRILAVALLNMNALSAFKVTDSINSFALIFIAGVSGSLIPFVGVFSSEKDTRSIRQLLSIGFKWGGVMIAAFVALCLMCTRQTAGLFGMDGADSMAAALPAIRLFALSLPLSMANNILVCLYQANRNTTAANVLTLGRSFVWVIAAALVLSPRMGVMGVWHSFWIAELLALVTAVGLSALYRRENNHRSRLFLLDTEAESKGAFKSFSVKNSPASIAESAAGIGEFCEANELNPKQAMALSLAIEEMLVSIRAHSLSGDDGLTINVRILIWDRMVIMRIRNAGKAFNPIAYYEHMRARESQHETRDELAKLDMLSDSLGIKMILDMAENVDYRNTFGVNNITVVL